MSNIIEFKGVDFSYIIDETESASGKAEKITVLENLNLAIEKGSFVAVLGHNGSGKSTLAKLTNGILFADSGEVLIDGVANVDDDSIFEVRKKVGMVFQNPDNQIVSSIVEEDVAFGVENLGVPPEECRRRVDEALKTVGMYEYRDKAPSKLSGGQKQRVAVAGIIAMMPECIVLDEPTAMLDPSGRREVLEAALELNRQEGVTIILITHYMEEVIRADRVFVMDSGSLALSGTPREVFSQVERLKELRLDVPQATLLGYELRKAGLPVPKGILSREELVEVFLKLKDEGKTGFFSTHITSDLEKCADRILFLQQGQLKADDTLDNFREAWRIAECGKEIPEELKQAARGCCRIREGYTVLVRAEDAAGFETREASLEEIMIHLEKEAEEA